MLTLKINPAIVIGVTAIVMTLVALTWYIPEWPLVVALFVGLGLFCPGFNVLSGECSDRPADYILPWMLFFAVAGLVGFGVWRWRSHARRVTADQLPEKPQAP